ncbi:DUF2752 domain-containing protein [Butyrivibrio sp. AE2032]|uniref:DUF2752 domain-containing protein n=1 Tax=Butyrivibrio sp. AE2032 TaxID=1458463 RepID=UPI00055872EF|nr:DUF2752 domain-containing protein [Butyrivibrio sp. AE2032]
MKKYREALTAVLAIALIYIVFYIVGVGCPIKFLTGISCAGCGMTRAYLSLLRLDVAAAFHYHPLFPLPPLVLLLVLFRKRVPDKIYKLMLFTITGVFLIIYLLRLFDATDTVVVFEPTRGFIYRIFEFLGRILKNVL